MFILSQGKSFSTTVINGIKILKFTKSLTCQGRKWTKNSLLIIMLIPPTSYSSNIFYSYFCYHFSANYSPRARFSPLGLLIRPVRHYYKVSHVMVKSDSNLSFSCYAMHQLHFQLIPLDGEIHNLPLLDGGRYLKSPANGPLQQHGKKRLYFE